MEILTQKLVNCNLYNITANYIIRESFQIINKIQTKCKNSFFGIQLNEYFYKII